MDSFATARDDVQPEVEDMLQRVKGESFATAQTGGGYQRPVSVGIEYSAGKKSPLSYLNLKLTLINGCLCRYACVGSA